MTKQIDALHKLIDDAILNQEKDPREYKVEVKEEKITTDRLPWE